MNEIATVDYEKEINQLRSYYKTNYCVANIFYTAKEKAREVGKVQSLSGAQICLGFFSLIDDNVRKYYKENDGQTSSYYFAMSETELNQILCLCKEHNSSVPQTVGSVAGSYIGGSLFGFLGYIGGALLGAIAGNKVNDNNVTKFLNIAERIVDYYFDVLLNKNEDYFKRVGVWLELKEKYHIPEEEMLKIINEFKNLNINPLEFSTLEPLEKVYIQLHPVEDAKSNYDPKKSPYNRPALEELEALIGLTTVKTQVKRLRAVLLKDKGNIQNINLNMCFYGNPGTGKTKVARIIANILFEEGLLKTNKLIETDRSGLVGSYVGETALKTHEIVKKAINGVLFIDEAYMLYESKGGFDDQYGKEAIAALLVDMEKYRGRICIILAGYRQEMEEMIAKNPGFDSRINRRIEFPDYSVNELIEILKIDVKKYSRKISNRALAECKTILGCYSQSPSFANGRTVRNLVEELRDIQAERSYYDPSDITIKLEDVKTYENEHNMSFESINENYYDGPIAYTQLEYDNDKYNYGEKTEDDDDDIWQYN